MGRKLFMLAAIAIVSLILAGCHGYNHRYSGTVGYTWYEDPFYYREYHHRPRHHRHRHRRHR